MSIKPVASLKAVLTIVMIMVARLLEQPPPLGVKSASGIGGLSIHIKQPACDFVLQNQSSIL